jgi:hypothetical protein
MVSFHLHTFHKLNLKKYLIKANYNRFLEQYESTYVEASNDVPKYLSNPINAYLLIKRLSSDLKQVESVINQHSEQGIFKF